jgi:LPPG:FO 2-phospho-L-lactate transferase
VSGGASRAAAPRRVLALCGGVGGAKLAHGLATALAPGELCVVVNTGDDFRHLGLYVAPDLDSVMYALAGLSDPVRGWGRREETWTFMAALRSLGAEDWFQLGDADLAVHVERTWRLAAGATLSEVTAHLCERLGIDVRVLPMSDDPVHTRVRTDDGWLDFQQYFVQHQCRPMVREFHFEGAERAHPHPQVLAALTDATLRAVVICPSNPFVSIEPILAVPGMREALQRSAAPIVAVTPIIGGRAVKGPAAKMLAELGLPVNGLGVAQRYTGLVDTFLLDESDSLPEGRQSADAQPMRFDRTATLMVTPEDRLRLAHEVLRIADELPRGTSRA